MTTTNEVMRLAGLRCAKWAEYWELKSFDDAAFKAADTALRTAVEALVSERDAARAALAPAVPQWPMRGARVDGDTVVISVKGGNDAARWLCGELVSLIDAAPSPKEPT